MGLYLKVQAHSYPSQKTKQYEVFTQDRMLLMRWRVFFLFLFVICRSYAQTSIDGRVFDSEDKTPLIGASIQLVETDRQKGKERLIVYAIADDQGRYKLTLPSPPNNGVRHLLLYRCMGFKAISAEINIPLHKTDIHCPDVYMLPSETKLKEVTVESSSVRLHGDTIKYLAHAYSDAGTRTLADLISRIPGLEVEASGTVKYQGKTINEFYIEGFPSVGNNYGLVVNNLDVDAVSGVEVLQNHQRVRALKDIEVSDQAALNILLKEKYKLLPTGQLEAGGGYEGRLCYDTNLYGMLISRKSQTVVSLIGDNHGSLREEGGFALAQGADMPEAGSLITMGGRTAPPIPERRYVLGNDFSSGAMHANRVGEYGILRLGAGYSHQDAAFDVRNKNVYYSGDEGLVTISEESIPTTNKHDIAAEVYYTYNSDSLFLENDLSVLGSHHRFRNDIVSHTQYLYGIKQVYGSFNNAFHYIRKTKKGKTKRFMTNLFGRTLPTGRISVQQGEKSMVQLIDGYDFGGHFAGGYSGWIGKHLSISTSMMLDAVCRGYGLSDIGEFPDIDNHYRGYDLNASFVSGIVFDDGDLRIESYLPLTFYGRSFKNGTEKHPAYSAKEILPEWNTRLRYILSSMLSLDWAFVYTNKLDMPATLISQPIIADYNQIITHTAGAIARNRTYTTNLSLRYNNVLSGQNVTSSISFVKIGSNLLKDFNVSPDQISYTTQSYKSSGYTWTTSHFLSWRLRPLALKADLFGLYSYSRTEAMRAGIVYPIFSHRFLLRPKLIFTPFRSFSWEISANWEYLRMSHHYAGQSFRSDLTNLKGASRFTWQTIPQCDLFASIDYMRLEQKDGTRRNIFFADTGIRYRFDRYELSATVDNIFDTDSYENSYQVGMDSFYSFYYLRPRCYMFMAKISF
ncbi:hypothetical protein PGJ_00002130 [Porphyromonas gingivalis AJW4]|nr:hypothetical protein PGJ_00002130 [Porphyromonas gingivalis AJW4]